MGGMGNTYGAILGAFIITVLPELLRVVSPVMAQSYGSLRLTTGNYDDRETSRDNQQFIPFK